MTNPALKFDSPVFNNFASDFVDSAGLVFEDVILNAGERLVVAYIYRGLDGLTVDAPSWNSQVATPLELPFGPGGIPRLFYLVAYELTAETSGSHDLLGVVTGGSGFTRAVAARFTFTGDFDLIPYFVETQAALDPWSAPSIELFTVNTGDYVLSLLGASKYDADFDPVLTDVTMNPSPSRPDIWELENANDNYAGTLCAAGYPSASNGIYSWSEFHSYEPGFAHLLILIKALPATEPEIVSINDDEIVVPGESGEMVVSNFVAASLSIGGIDVESFVNIDDENYTFVFPFFLDNDEYVEFDVEVDAVAVSADEVDEATLPVIVELPVGWVEVEITSLSSDPDSIAQAEVGVDTEVGDFYYALSSQINLFPDTTFNGAAAGTVYVWLRKTATNIMHRIEVINGEVAPSSGGWAPIEFIQPIGFFG
jgi:hypothetical protein